MSDILSSIRWGWALLAGLVAQLLLIAGDYALSALTAMLGWMQGETLLTRAAAFLIFFLAGLWVARHARKHFTANGLVVGIVGVAIFVPMLIAVQTPYPGMAAITETLKIVGAALGGGLIGHRKRRGIRRQARKS